MKLLKSFLIEMIIYISKDTLLSMYSNLFYIYNFLDKTNLCQKRWHIDIYYLLPIV